MKYMIIICLIFVNAVLMASAAVTFARQITESEIQRHKAAETEMLKREFEKTESIVTARDP